MESEPHSVVLDDNQRTATNGDATSEQGPSKDPSSSYENNICVRDVVRKKANTGIGAVVTRLWMNGETDLVRVHWMDGTEKTENINNVEALDRQFFIGEHVASVHDPTGQIGVVVDVNINVDLLAQDGSVLRGKPSKDLRPIRNLGVGDYVVLGHWLGRIKYVSDNVTVQLDNGSVCQVMNASPMHLKPVGEYDLEDIHLKPVGEYDLEGVHSPYFVGQRVQDHIKYVFKNATWLSGLWDADYLEGTVIRVTEVSVGIKWLVSNGHGPDPFTAPSEEQPTKLLKLLSCFSHIKWQWGEFCLLNNGCLKLVSNETYGEFYEEVVTAEEYVNIKASSSKKAETSDNNAPASKDVVHETWPTHRKKILKVVVSRDKKSQKKTASFERALLIVNTHSEVDVAWQDGTLERGIDSTCLLQMGRPEDNEFLAEQYVVKKGDDASETRIGVVKSVNAKDRMAMVKWLTNGELEHVSVYELKKHSEYDYTYGDFVVRLPPVSSLESSPSHDMATEFSELPWVGNITGLEDGDIEVTWAEGMKSTVDPKTVYVFPRNDDDSSYSWGTESNDDSSASGSESGEDFSASEWEIDGDDMVSVDNAEEHGTDDEDTRSEIELEIAETLCNFKLPQSEEFTFKGFDTVRDPSDHHFLASQAQNSHTKWVKRVEADWKILQDNLPENIYVRTYEDRIDLLRAVIVGPYGTPYQDGLFFFDFLLAPDYPHVPPSVYYHSRGWHINPNLYKGGKVCLSLLDTWEGKENEVWTSKSTILQVLVSLQGLVLNSKPYFNEAWYDERVGTVHGERESKAYNEKTFVQNCKKMIADIRKPPKDFEGFLINHYRERGYYILKACDAYIKGHLVGSLGKDSLSVDRSTESNSEGFKVLLRKITPRLFSCFKALGADIEEFENFNPTGS